jgi:Prophage minor tail protein Z (GPZ)
MKIGVKYDDLIKYQQRLKEGEKAVKPRMAASLNKVGDDLVSVLTRNISKETGLAVEQVRGMMQVKRSTKNDLTYKLNVDRRVWSDDPRTLEGRRESKDFGRTDPKTLVIIINQDDDLVCTDCEALAAAGPMPIEIAREHIPKHPNCRCIIMPYAQKGKRLPVEMTSLTGTNPEKRAGRQNRDLTIRQMAQEIINKTVTDIKISLK